MKIKPVLKKVVIILIILIITIPYLLSTAITYDEPMSIPAAILLIGLFWPFFAIYYLESLIIPNLDWIHAIDIPFIIVALIINVSYLYGLATLILIPFNKKKNGKNINFKTRS